MSEREFFVLRTIAVQLFLNGAAIMEVIRQLLMVNGTDATAYNDLLKEFDTIRTPQEQIRKGEFDD